MSLRLRARARLLRHFRSRSQTKRGQARRSFWRSFDLLEPRRVLSGTPIISEFLASNSGGLQDADGESSDWIELYNPTAAPVNLAGWTLTDDAGDLNQWAFPSVTIGANQFLTVFASGKDRTGPELHTNFRLSASGEFLALVDPAGTIASQYAPTFPPQVSNVSYGVGFDTAQLIVPGADAHILVPSNNGLGQTWTSPSFNPAGWISGDTGIGFGVVQPGFNVKYVKANVSVDNLGVAQNVLANTGLQSNVVYANAPLVNYLANGGGGNYGNDLAFPTQTIGDDINDFVVEATGYVKIPVAGTWTFGVNSDDGFLLRLERNGVVLQSQYYDPRPAFDTIANFSVPEAGDWSISLIMYERAGGASVEMFAAPGLYATFSAADFDLVGDVANGGLEAYSPVGSGSDVVVGTDIGPQMQGINSSAYVRIPFEVSNPAQFDALLLKMRYDDGFVAWLNGTEVARRNAPATLAYDSAATIDRSMQEAITPEVINLTSYLSSLVAGTNVLAVQGLNSSPADSSFLVLPELTASAVHTDMLRYFATVTPGDPNRDPALGVVDRVTTSIAAGFYNSPFSVALATPTAGAQIRYTTDGSTPTDTNGVAYSGPISIGATTTLRAGAFLTDYISLPSITRTYLFVNDVISQSPSDDVAGGHPDVGQPPPGWPASWGNNVVDYGMDQTVVQQEGANAIKDALLAIPSISLTTDLPHLFDPATGIYANAYNDGRDWERPASMELLNPDGSPGFQVNAGLRIRGGYSRSGDNPKHAFRLFFRGVYGDSSLDFPMFGAEGTNSFKKIDLRTAQNYSWSFGGDPSNSMIQDVFSRDTQRDLGQAYTRSRPYHLYINGQYWGIYETQERAEAEYAASYFGGSAANYDVIKPEAGPYQIYATDGNLNAYFRLWQYVTAQDLSSNANYFHIQGKDANGADDISIPNDDVLLDVDNLVTYMLGILHSGNLDAPISAFLGNNAVNNFFAIRDRLGRQGFRYFQHDAEHTLRNINEDRNGPFPAGQQFPHFNPQFLHQQLMANAEYRLKFADAVQKAFFNEGAMTVVKQQQRFMNRANMLDQAIRAESARWGDSKRPTDPLGRAHWQAAVDQVVNNFLANRNPVVLAQFQSRGLFPAVTAPTFLINGVPKHSGQVTPGSLLRFAAPAGIVYYTNNGEDPRLPGGGINPNALSYDPGVTTETLVASGSNWKYHDQGVDQGTAWRQSSFNDSGWAAGNAELGYGDGDETTVVSYGPNASAKYITTYFRKAFNVANAANVTGLRLRLKRDDGAVVYINGVEATRSNMPGGTITAATLASSAVGGSDESTFYEIDLNATLLITGNNVIAVELHQSNATSSDISFDAELLASSQSNPGLTINESTSIKARVLIAADWSPLSAGTFSTAAAATAANLAVAELHYNPAPFPGGTTAPFNDKDNFEFIELRNISAETITLTGVRFTVGITFDFSAGDVAFLAPGESVVVVKNQLAFEARYGALESVAGVFSGNLNNGGEQVILVDATGATIRNFTYDDDATTTPPWPQTPDGGGYSLTVKDVLGNLSAPANWRASYLLHGTPGYEENDYPANLNLSNDTVNENSAGAVVGNLTATDPNLGDTLSFSIVPGNDGALFEVVGTQLRVGAVPLDYEESPTRVVTARVTDSGGLFIDRTFTIHVNNLPDPNTDIRVQSAVTTGLSQVTVTYAITNGNAPAFELSFLRSADGLSDLGDTLLDTVTISAATDRTVGTHTLVLNIGAAAADLSLPGTATADVEEDYQLLVVADLANLIDEFDVDPLQEDNTKALSGVYLAGGQVFLLGTAADDSAVVTKVGTTTFKLTHNGTVTTFSQASTTGFRLRGGAGNDTLSILNIPTPGGLFGGAGNDTLVGGTLADALEGGAGNDLLQGRSGNDTYFFDVETAQGTDTLEDSGGIDGLDFSRTAAGTNLSVNLGITGSQNVHATRLALILGTSVIENVTGGQGNDLLIGNAAANRMEGRGGNDELRGSSGNDTYIFDTDTALGRDTLVDSAGVELLDFSGTATLGITLTLSMTTLQTVNSNLELVLGASVWENVSGTSLADSITGNAANNQLEGLAGNDTLRGAAGNDVYLFDADSPLGDDRLEDTTGNDTLNFSATSTLAVLLDLNSTAFQAVNANLNLTLAAAVFENATGGLLADTLLGNALANKLEGKGGNDTLNGGAGNDSYIFDADSPIGTDTLLDASGTDLLNLAMTTTQTVTLDLALAAEQTVNANLNLILGSSIFEDATGGSLNDILSGNSAANDLTGGAGNDTLTGSSGNDTLTGGAGNDLLQGGAGNDAYRFDGDLVLGSDTVDETGGSGVDLLDFSMTTTKALTVDLSNSAAQVVVPANLTLTLVSSGTQLENITGGSLGDTLTGNGLANLLFGGAGNDTLTGGTGNDIYKFDADLPQGSDVISDASGIDAVDYSLSTMQAVTVNLGLAGAQAVHANHTLTLGSSTAIEIAIGGSKNDTLIGNTLANILLGGVGNDTLTGGAGRDLLIGGAGNDSMDGGTEDDLLISGTTAYDSVIDSLLIILGEWTSANMYNQRVNNLRAGVSGVMLTAKVKVLNAGTDTLSGGADLDWFFAGVDEVITDLAVGEANDVL